MSKISINVKSLSALGATAIAMALTMIVPFEGMVNTPYEDVGGVLTVCAGHTGSDIDKDKTYTKAECDELLEKDLAAVKKQVDPLIKTEIPEHTRAALYSFTFNVGIGSFTRSTLLKKLNHGDLTGACSELKRWVYVGGKKWRGLISRRQIEEEICSYQPP